MKTIKPLVACVFTVVLAGCTSHVNYQPTGEDFCVTMPGVIRDYAIRESTQTLRGKYSQARGNMFVAVTTAAASYDFRMMDEDPDLCARMMREKVQQSFRKPQKRVETRTLFYKKIDTDRYQARAVAVKVGDEDYGTIRWYFANNRCYLFFASGPTATPGDPHVAAFFDSIKIL